MFQNNPFANFKTIFTPFGIFKFRLDIQRPRFSRAGLRYMVGGMSTFLFKPLVIEKRIGTGIKIGSGGGLLNVLAAVSIDIRECPGHLVSVGTTLGVFGFVVSTDLAILTPTEFFRFWRDVFAPYDPVFENSFLDMFKPIEPVAVKASYPARKTTSDGAPVAKKPRAKRTPAKK